VNKDFHRHIAFAANAANFVEGTFAGEDDATDTELGYSRNSLAARKRHLRAGMDGQIGADRAKEADEAKVLDENGIDAGDGDLADEIFNLWQLAGEDKRVERDVALESASVKVGHQPGEIGDIEILGAGAGVEAGIEAEINGISAVFDRCAHAVSVTGGSEKFGAGQRSGRHGDLTDGGKRAYWVLSAWYLVHCTS